MSLWGNLLTLFLAIPLVIAFLVSMSVAGCFYFTLVCFRVAFCGFVVEAAEAKEKDDADKRTPEVRTGQ